EQPRSPLQQMAMMERTPQPERILIELDTDEPIPGTSSGNCCPRGKASIEKRLNSRINHDNGPCLGWRERRSEKYQWMHYNETLLRAKNLGAGLLSCYPMPQKCSLVGLYCQNCPEWVLIEQACYMYSLVLVPLYDTLGPDASAFIIHQAEMALVICEDDKKCNLILDKSP
ncbi:hypothetical protein QAD02_021366, partial [Eretmocerus hayati]